MFQILQSNDDFTTNFLATFVGKERLYKHGCSACLGYSFFISYKYKCSKCLSTYCILHYINHIRYGCSYAQRKPGYQFHFNYCQSFSTEWGDTQLPYFLSFNNGDKIRGISASINRV